MLLYKTQLTTVAIAMAAMAMTGCGGGSSPTAQPINTSLSGKVIDGYIEGATVCLDLNNNQACDSDEPWDKSVAGGGYKLDISGLSTDKIKAAHLLTVIPTTAKDADDDGKTLAEVGKSAFNLLAPAAAFFAADGTLSSAVISPLTTLVSHEMIAGNNMPLATAEANVRGRLKLATTADLRQDFVANKEGALIAKAQMLAMAIAEVKKVTLADTTAKPTDQQALMAALSYLQTQVAVLQTAFDAAKAANANAKTVDAVKTALATDTAKPVTGDLVSQAKQVTDSSITSAATVLAAGFYSADQLDNCNGSCSSYYTKISGGSGKLNADAYQLSATGWVPDPTPSGDYSLTANGWVQDDGCKNGTFTEEGNSTSATCNGTTVRVSARTVDASGKKLSDLVPSLPSAYANAVMPTGSALYWLTFANIQDEYRIDPGNPIKDGYLTTSKPFTSLDNFIKAYTTTTSSPFKFIGRNGLNFSFDAGGTASGGSLSLYGYPTNTALNTAGKASYERRTFGGQEVLIIQAPSYSSWNMMMFAVKDGVLYGGDFTPSTAPNQSAFFANKTMLNAILKIAGKPEVLN